MHQLYTLIEDVEKTHLGLGNMMAFSIICVKARKCLLNVAPPGCGKSVITNTLGNLYPDTYVLDSATTASLAHHNEEFSHFRGLVTIDDMAKISDAYSRKHTLTAFTELVYSHFITRFTHSASVVISDFNGSAILNIQPVILGEICQYPEWESVLQDKTIRYYHLYRPIVANEHLPNCKVDWGIDLDLVEKPSHSYKLYSRLEEVCSIQWSDSRILEHLGTLLKAIAALDRRQVVRQQDYILLARLIKPMTIERHIFRKAGFELGRWMDVNLLDVLVEFASWKDCNIARIARDYKISEATTYRLLAEIHEWFVPSQIKAKALVPKAEFRKVLKEAGVER